jgi:hypothetical protein
MLLLLSVTPVAAVLAPGCAGNPGELCDLRCECTHCNDLAEEFCLIDEQADQDRADAYDCADEYDTWIECAIDHNDCNDENNNFTIDESCSDERQELVECEANASSLTSAQQGPDGPVTNTTVQQTTTQTVSSSTSAGGFGGMPSTGGMGGMGGVGGAGGA